MNSAYQNLAKYEQYSESNSCYLDGRYFNAVFCNHPGLIANPLYIHIDENMNVSSILPNSFFLKEHIGLLRVIITSNTIRHSMLVILQDDIKSAHIYDPDVHNNPNLHTIVVDSIIKYLSNFLNYKFFDVVTSHPMETPIIGCEKTGFCNAFVIKYAYDFLNNVNFKASSIEGIRKFMCAIESNYELPPGVPDIEYDWSGSQIVGTAGGAAIGAGIGALTFGWPGALILGGLGGVAGYGIGSAINR